MGHGCRAAAGCGTATACRGRTGPAGAAGRARAVGARLLPVSPDIGTAGAAGVGSGDPAAGGSYDVLMLDAGSRQSLAALRSLGRAGLRVAAAECFAECDPALPVPAFRSRYCAGTAVFRNYALDPAGFAEDVLGFVRSHAPRAVLPASDGAIAVLLPYRDRLRDLGCTLALPSDAALAIANDKGRTLKVAARLGIDQPCTVQIHDPDQLPSVLAGLGLPVVLKPTSSWAGRAGVRLNAAVAVDVQEARELAAGFLAAGAGVLAQQWLPGRREGVSLLLAGGEVRACFAHLEHRTTPLLGGASVVRESIPVPADLYRLSVDLVTAIGLDGLSEVEFRRDGSGRPYLMEINARLAGTTEIAVHCGVDLPRLLWQWATGAEVEPACTYRTGVRMRWLRGDMRWVRDNRGQAGRPDGLGGRRALAAFVAEFARSRRYDCWDRRDPAPFRAELIITAAAVRDRVRGRQEPPEGRETEGIAACPMKRF